MVNLQGSVMNIYKKIALVTVAAVFTAAAQADEHVAKNYFDLLGSAAKYDREKSVDDGLVGISGRIGREMNERWNLELASNAFNADGDASKGGVDIDQWSIGGNALAVFNRGGGFQPYLLAGLGGIDSRYKGGGRSRDYYYDVGAGAIIPIFDGKGRLRGEVVRRAENDAFDSKDYILNIGFGVPFGKKAEPVVMAAAPVDSDGDGVTDDLDQCPNTPAGAAVDAVGCELDSDGDGVVDSKDKCPGTPLGTQVDADGCPIVIVINLEGVNFRTNSAELLDGAEVALNDDVATLVAKPDVLIEVAGHTDSDGEADYNLDLSQRRAEAVRTYLIGKGVEADRISAKGYGEAEPVASNASAAGKAQNRRVELRIKNK